MSLRRLASKSSFLYQDHERGDKYCTSPVLERKLEVFAWVPGHKAPEGNVFARLVNRSQDPTKPHQCYYKHEATIPDFISKIDLSQFTLTPPSQCDLELVQTVTDHLRRKHKKASDGWRFKSEISSGRGPLLPHRDPDAHPRKIVLLEREVPCECGRGTNCFRVRTSAGRAYSAALRRQAASEIENNNRQKGDRKVKARLVSPPPGSAVTWIDPPEYEEGDDGLECSLQDWKPVEAISGRTREVYLGGKS